MRERGCRVAWRLMKAGGPLSTVPVVLKNPGEVVFMGGMFMESQQRDRIVEARMKETVAFHWEGERAKRQAGKEWRAWRRENIDTLILLLALWVEEKSKTCGDYQI